MQHACRICGNAESNRSFECAEKMFGWGEAFRYFQCATCGCLQIAGAPPDLGRYYPPAYYSYSPRGLARGGWKSRVAAYRDYAIATGGGPIGNLLHRVMPAQDSLVPLGRIPLAREMRILDVGCGSGLLLNYLDRAGFKSLAGIDPFLPADVVVTPRVRVRKLQLDELDEQFDLIMLHHVFEHLESGEQTLANCRSRLTKRGKILLRIPTADSEAWDLYRENWVGLDAPRHFFLHTRSSLEILARKNQLEIEQWFCDSTAMQFWASELYKKGIPLQDDNGQPSNPAHYFSSARLKEFHDRTTRLNHTLRGDQVVVILRPVPASIGSV